MSNCSLLCRILSGWQSQQDFSSAIKPSELKHPSTATPVPALLCLPRLAPAPGTVSTPLLLVETLSGHGSESRFLQPGLLFWLRSVQLLDVTAGHSWLLGTLYLLYVLHSHGCKSHLYANNSRIYISCLALPLVLLSYLSKLLTWQLHMDVSLTLEI